jgi:hypothetical protein
MSGVTHVAAFWTFGVEIAARTPGKRVASCVHAFMRGSSERVRTRARSVFRSMREPNLGISRNRCLALVKPRRAAQTRSCAHVICCGLYSLWDLR